jgi:SAM-dependent methyltransferase
MQCRHCGAELTLTVANLGLSPVANDYVDADRYREPEPFYPLEARVCRTCRLVQAVDVRRAEEIFRADYAYFSSHSTTWLDHARTYVDAMVQRFGLGAESQVIEVASNDGYLLQFARGRGLRCLGIEPSESVALAARGKGIETRIEFFGSTLADKLVREGRRADLLVANNVLAHVPDINDFVRGAATLLADDGVATFEIQHLLKLMQRHQFDTIYHEHFSYLSLLAAQRIFDRAALRVFDAEELETHGGSIRFFVCRTGAGHRTSGNVERILREEIGYGLAGDEAYRSWSEGVKETKRALLEMLIGLKRQGKSIVGYGAPAKGVTLLNYCGIGPDFLDYTVDRAPSKIGRFMPGIRLPIRAPDAIFETRPDYILILPWNIKDEIKTQLGSVRDWGAKFIMPIPKARIES